MPLLLGQALVPDLSLVQRKLVSLQMPVSLLKLLFVLKSVLVQAAMLLQALVLAVWQLWKALELALL